jgi:hypothetical protein
MRKSNPRSASSRLTLPSATGRLLRPFLPRSVSVLVRFVVIIYSFRDRSSCVPAGDGDCGPGSAHRWVSLPHARQTGHHPHRRVVAMISSPIRHAITLTDDQVGRIARPPAESRPVF